MTFWLVKSEPDDWSFDDQKSVASEPWDGVRNAQAQKNMRSMEEGDLVFFYHSGKAREIVGLTKVVREPYPDPDGAKPSDVLVDLAYVSDAGAPLSLAAIKADGGYDHLALVRQARLSVMPIDNKSAMRLMKAADIPIPDKG